MKNISKVTLKRCAIALLFVILAGVGLLISKSVGINYNLADYLDDTTETRAAIDIIEDEFGMTGSVQVMVRDVDVATAKEIKSELSAVDGVLMVSFDAKDENSYKNNTALFVLLLDDDDYSQRANDVVASIQELLSDRYGDIEYGGSVVKQTGLKNSTKNEMSLIISIVICIVIVLLMVTAKSWIEPLVLLAASGIAIAINMGLNILLGEISFITNSISSILQLALSIDYSIVLLHTYRDNKLIEPDSSKAMKLSVKQVAKPVAASALTTMAGLLALLFMAFRIGFDIGVVLIKGIVVSALTSMTLLPILILLLEKLLQKTEKKAFIPEGKIFSKIAFKGYKIVAPVALVAIILGAILQSFNTYCFTDDKGENMTIIDEFGKKSSIVLVYEKGEGDYEKEVEFYNRIKDYRNKDGKLVLEKYNSYATSVLEVYDADKIETKLGLSRDYADMLFAMHALYNDKVNVELSFNEFINYTDYLVKNDPDVAGMLDENMAGTITLMKNINEIMAGEYTADELADLLSGSTVGDSGISSFALRQMFGLYYYDSVTNKSVAFEDILDKLIEASESDDTKDMFSEDMASALLELEAGIAELESGIASLKKPLDTKMTQKEFGAYMNDTFGKELMDGIVTLIFKTHLGHSPATSERVALVDLLHTIATTDALVKHVPEDKVETLKNIKGYHSAYNAIKKSYAYDKFIPALTDILDDLGESREIDVDASAIQQIYIMYFYDKGVFGDEKLATTEFISFVRESVNTNETVASQVTTDTLNKLDDLETIDEFFKDSGTYDYSEICTRITGLTSNIKSASYDVSLDEGKISGVYIKYMIANGIVGTTSLVANEFVDFICENMETNSLLKAKMTDEHRAQLKEAQAAIEGAPDLLIGENHSRALLTVSLAAESPETTAYIDYLFSEVDAVFGENAYITGEVISTYDLQKAFTSDNIVISVFTIISIFVIILLVFKSLSLPPLLVAIIQGAIWIALSTQLISGNSIFFMSYIVTTCVLMGATIDYGILMSSSYVTNRAEKDKKDALVAAIAATTPTVFTSGIILIICGFVISLISTQNSISSVGDLLAKGTIVSVIMIMLVLPSLLYILDKFILALTMKRDISFREILEKLKQVNWRELPAKCGKAIVAFFKKLPGFIKYVAKNIKPICKSAVQQLKRFFVWLGSAIARLAKLIFSKTRAFFAWLGPKIRALAKGIATLAKKIATAIKGLCKKAANGVKSLYQKIKPKVLSLFTKISDFFKKIIEKIKNKK